ncbi:Ankyrin repeat and zinc finger domain-containing protein 1 [Operophtera brumata]|uniref:Ankyrin repeat and zinc finger domain-containing protein 1 n=1 Tax=Operophtera brumata TaxID=104452 RepID=A0A0L7LLI2_OPEBR|nr:Ankyrin repeat and zinc finger domain-containing protein 1 [Operophtera brumata]
MRLWPAWRSMKSSPLRKDDLRVRQLPFPTRKPSYKEVQRVHETVASLEIYEQARNGHITNSRKDLLLDVNQASAPSSVCSENESENVETRVGKKKRKENKPEKKEDSKPVKKEENKVEKEDAKKGPTKITANVKKIWNAINQEQTSLETILETWEGEDLSEVCNIPDPVDGNTALHKAAIAARPDMSQIPGPLTPELLEQEKERKAQQKRAKRQREKEKQVEKAKTNKFLQLDDKDKAPFEYNNYQFCTIKCLQNHRNIRPLNLSV